MQKYSVSLKLTCLKVTEKPPNNSFKPKPLRYTKGMAGKACHAFASTTRFGLTQVLALYDKTSSRQVRKSIRAGV